MSANPWDKFWWNDWENDPALKLCSLAAQGLWMRALCICAKADPKGYLVVAGRPLDSVGLASLAGKPEPEVETLLRELASYGVFSTDRTGRIYSRRMVRDVKKSRIAVENGSMGGNPSLGKGRGKSGLVNQVGNLDDKPHKPESRSQNRETDADASVVGRADVQAAFDQWNEMAARCGLPKALKLDADRRKVIRARLHDGGLPAWSKALLAVEHSPHCRGKNDRGWRADLDFVCQLKSWRRLREGSYGSDVGQATDIELATIAKFQNAPIRDCVVREKGEPFAVSYLDTCAFSDEGGTKTIIAPNAFIATQLAKGVPALERRGARIVVQSDSTRSAA